MNTAALSPEASYTGVPDLRRMATCESILRVKCFCQNMQQSLFHPEWSLTGSTLKSPHLWSFSFHTYITAQKLWLQRGAWMFSKHSTVKHPLLVTAYIRGISEHANNSRCQSQNTCRCCFVDYVCDGFAQTCQDRLNLYLQGCFWMWGVRWSSGGEVQSPRGLVEWRPGWGGWLTGGWVHHYRRCAGL